MDQRVKQLLQDQLKIMNAAAGVLRESAGRVSPILASNKASLSVEEKESCEALTARFARLCDFLFQRIFRTIDRIELLDDGTAIDRLNRMEKRGIISSANTWKELRDLRNDIAHEYLIESSDRVLKESFQKSTELLNTVEAVQKYLQAKGYA